MVVDFGVGVLIVFENGLLYVCGVIDVLLFEVMIGWFLFDMVGCFFDCLVVVFCEQQVCWIWCEFVNEIDVLVVGFVVFGIVKGDCVGIWLLNCSEWLFMQFVIVWIGVVFVNINLVYWLLEFEYVLNKVGCKVVIVVECFKSFVYVEMLQIIVLEFVIVMLGDLYVVCVLSLCMIVLMGEVVFVGMFCFVDVMVCGCWVVDLVLFDVIGVMFLVNDLINIQFMSGMIGSLKGVMFMYCNVVNNVCLIVMVMCFIEQDLFCILVLFYYCFGMVLVVFVCVLKGVVMVFFGEVFDLVVMFVVVVEECCIVLYGVLMMFIVEFDYLEFVKFDLLMLCIGIMVGLLCLIEMMKCVVLQMYFFEIMIVYGMMEMSFVLFQSLIDDLLEKCMMMVGCIQLYFEVKIVDLSGDIVLVGVMGELCMKGYLVMFGYWDDDVKMCEVLVDGWMYIGDFVMFDVDGYCNIVGCLKDMVICGGENVYLCEIEEFLFWYLKIQSVQVFGVFDVKYGEELCVWIVLCVDEQMIEDDVCVFCNGQIVYYKILCYICFVDELLMMVMGKVQKFVMCDWMIEELKFDVQKIV